MDIETTAMITELEEQRNLAFTRCGQLAAQLAVANQRRLELAGELDAERAKSKPDNAAETAQE